MILKITNDELSWPIWDEILASYLLGHCQIETKKRPILLENGYFNYYTDVELMPIRWITFSDSSKTWENFITVVK